MCCSFTKLQQKWKNWQQKEQLLRAESSKFEVLGGKKSGGSGATVGSGKPKRSGHSRIDSFLSADGVAFPAHVVLGMAAEGKADRRKSRFKEELSQAAEENS